MTGKIPPSPSFSMVSERGDEIFPTMKKGDGEIIGFHENILFVVDFPVHFGQACSSHEPSTSAPYCICFVILISNFCQLLVPAFFLYLKQK